MTSNGPTGADRAGAFDPAGVDWTPVSPRLAGARRASSLMFYAVVALAVAVPALIVDQTWLWLLLAAVPVGALASWVLIGRQVRAWGYAEREDDLLVRHGLMFRELVVVPYGRMQYVDVQSGPLERVFRIAQVQLHTASAGTDARIPGLDPEAAGRLRDRLASRGRARLAGL